MKSIIHYVNIYTCQYTQGLIEHLAPGKRTRKVFKSETRQVNESSERGKQYDRTKKSQMTSTWATRSQVFSGWRIFHIFSTHFVFRCETRSRAKRFFFFCPRKIKVEKFKQRARDSVGIKTPAKTENESEFIVR